MTVEIINDPSYYRWSYHSFQQNCKNSAVPTSLLFYKKFDGTRTKVSRYPDWVQRLKHLENSTNPYHRSGYMFSHNPGYVYWSSSDACSDKRVLGGFVQGTSNNSVPSRLDLPSKGGTLVSATAKFAAQVDKANTHFSGGVFAGELRETLNMIRRPSRGIATVLQHYVDSLSGLRRRFPRGVRRGIMNESIQDLWLTYSFGLSPLLGDVKSGAEALSRLINGDRPTMQVRGYAEEEIAQVLSQTRTSLAGGLMYASDEIRTELTESTSIRGVVRPRASGPVWRTMDLFGFRSEQFIPTVWELLPMSWVTDYFTNVGDILSATYTDFTGLCWYSVSTKRSSSYSFVGGPAVLSPTGLASNGFTGGGSTGSWTLKRQVFSRSRELDFIPPLVFSYPGKPSQLLNLGALATKTHDMSVSLNRLCR